MVLLEKDSANMLFSGIKPVNHKRINIKWMSLGILALTFYLVTKTVNFHILNDNEIDFTETYLKALDINLASNWSKVYTSGPHLAGKGTYLANFTKDKFEEYGAVVEWDEYEVLVSYPVDHDLNLVNSKTGKVIYKAPLKEDVIDEDETTKGNDTIPTFLGYGANGNVTAQYVYVNYGSKEDFLQLKELGIDITGKIAIVRYGKVFRGLKVKFAQDHGAIGVLIYSDPGDDNGITPAHGYKQYPKGPARQESSVQRGSTAFLGGVGSYPGDPTTPGYASRPGVERQDPSNAIPKIPVLPISYREVKPILKELNGHGVKLTDENWIGELEGFDYYTGPSKKHELNLYSYQDFNYTTLTNVYGKFVGENDDEIIVIGNHYDAWIKGGAGDPNSGSSVLLEIARALSELQKAGYKLKRSIYLTSWDGEEYSLLGSTEFGEYASKFLQKKIVAYLNLDDTALGPILEFLGPKSLLGVFKKAISKLPHPSGGSLLDHYLSIHGDEIGVLGSGSDYTVFLEHLGISSIDTKFGSNKTSPIYHYHSNYDSYHWMEKFGDKDFIYHGLSAKYLGLLALELSDSEVLQINLSDYVDDLIKFFGIVKDKIPKEWLTKTIDNADTWKNYLVTPFEEADLIQQSSSGWYMDTPYPFSELMQKQDCPVHRGRFMYDLDYHSNSSLLDIVQTTNQDLIDLKGLATIFDEQSKVLQVKWDNRDSLYFWQRIKLHFEIVKQNKLLQYFERNFLHSKGLHQREWFKHIVFASGRYTGYAGQVFPLSQEAIEDGDFDRLVYSLGVISKTFRRISSRISH